jgi:hypothetical protein
MARFVTPRSPRAALGALLVLGIATACAGGCDDWVDGSVTLVLDQPEVPLDPLLDQRVTRLSLVDDDTGAILGDAPLNASNLSGRTKLAALATGARNLRLEALSATSQVLAAARAFDIGLEQGSTHDVTMHLRKPLAYVGGGQWIQVTDTAASGLSFAPLDPVPLGGVKTMATTRGGELLLATIEELGLTSLVWVDTATHVERGRLPLGAPVRTIVIHPHDRYVVLLQTLSDTALLIRLKDLLEGTNLENAIRPFNVARPHSATFDQDDSLWVISSTPANCDAPSLNPGVLLHVDLDGNQLDAPVPLLSQASDIGINPLTRSPLVGLPCIGKVIELKAGVFADVAAVRGLGDVVLDGTSLYAVGWEPPTDPEYLPGVVSVLDLAREGEPATREVRFPIESIPLTLGEQDSFGNEKYLYISAMSLTPRNVTVTAHGGRVAFLHTLNYRLTTDRHTGSPTCTELQISLAEQGITLVDVESGAIVWKRPTGYDISCICDRVNIGSCITGLNEGLVDPAYTPTSLTLLTGGK